jgi:hypothetical protein
MCCLTRAIAHFRGGDRRVLSNDEIVISIGKLKKFREKFVPVEFVHHEIHSGLNPNLPCEKKVSSSPNYGMALNVIDL